MHFLAKGTSMFQWNGKYLKKKRDIVTFLIKK